MADSTTQFVVSAEALKKASGEFSLENVTRLELRSCNIDDTAAEKIAGMCPNLTDLDLSGNRLCHAGGLSGLKQLSSLTLTDNKLCDLKFARNLAHLEKLLVQGNSVETAADVEPLSELAMLTILYLQNIDESAQNPICQHIAYRPAVTMRIPSLKNLDGQRVAVEAAALKAPVPMPVIPSSDIPAQKAWVHEGYWGGDSGPPQVAAQQSMAFAENLRACRKLEASADAIIDRYTGFANIKGSLDCV